MITNYEEFAKRLCEERLKYNISQSTMSKKVHMLSSHYLKCEKGYNRFAYYELQNICTTEVNLFYCFTGRRGICSSQYAELLQNVDMEQLVCCLQAIHFCANVKRKKGLFKEEWEQIFNELKYLSYVDIGLADERNIFKAVREYDRLSQICMADELGMDVKKFRNLECGKILPDSEIVFQMFIKYNISPAAFLRHPKCFRDELIYLLNSHSGKVGDELLLLVKTILFFVE